MIWPGGSVTGPYCEGDWRRNSWRPWKEMAQAVGGAFVAFELHFAAGATGQRGADELVVGVWSGNWICMK